MYRATATSASGALDSGHYFCARGNAGSVEMVITDLSSVTARFILKTQEHVDTLSMRWLSAFLEVASLGESVGPALHNGSFRGRLRQTNQTISARFKNDELSLIISESDEPAFDLSQKGLVAAFAQRQIESARMHDVLAIWIGTYKRSIR